jgi:hypothetical protein
MANSFVRYTGDGNTASYSIPFSYRSTADLTVTLAGVASTAFTLNAAGTTLTFNATPSNGTAIEIRRKTSQGSKLVDYASGSVLTENDLDTDSEQAFFMSQEAIDDANDRIKVDSTNFQWDANNKRLTNVADPTSAQDAATKNYLENTWLSSSDKANINTLAGITNLGTLASNETNINIVATNNTNVTNVGSNITNVNTVANNIGSVNTVAADITKVIAVANDLAETVSEVQTVADDLNETTSEIDTVANNIANVNTVGNAIANVNNVGNNIANVNTVATNLTDINSFENTYKISATAPSSPVEGTLWFDTTADIMKVYDGSSFVNAGSSVNGTSGRFKYIATANQTTFTGASHSDTGGAVLTYDSGFINVFKNGVHLDPSDYTATDGNNVVLDVGCSVNDEIYILTFGTFSIASFSATAVTSDTLAVARGGTGLTTSNLTGNAGKALLVNSSANGFELQNASSAEVYGFEKFFTPSTLVRTVTVQSVGGSNKYFIDGVQQDTLTLHEGNTYVFNYPSAHPFKFSTTSDGTHNSGSEYTTGVTHNSSTQVTIVVASGAPTLYYYCSSHSGMGGTANTPTPTNNTVRVTTTNQGVDNISASDYANFDDVQFAASGFTWSLNNGELIATI